MNTVAQVMRELKKKGSAQTRQTYARHGAAEDMFGVKVGDLKPIAKKIKGNQHLACELYDTACKVPLATDYIKKIETMGRVGKKRKTMKC